MSRDDDLPEAPGRRPVSKGTPATGAPAAVPGTARAERVRTEDCTGATAQQWSVTASGSYVTITSRADGECLDVSGASTADSAAIITHTCNGGTNQQWTQGT